VIGVVPVEALKDALASAMTREGLAAQILELIEEAEEPDEEAASEAEGTANEVSTRPNDESEPWIRVDEIPSESDSSTSQPTGQSGGQSLTDPMTWSERARERFQEWKEQHPDANISDYFQALVQEWKEQHSDETPFGLRTDQQAAVQPDAEGRAGGPNLTELTELSSAMQRMMDQVQHTIEQMNDATRGAMQGLRASNDQAAPEAPTDNDPSAQVLAYSDERQNAAVREGVRPLDPGAAQATAQTVAQDAAMEAARSEDPSIEREAEIEAQQRREVEAEQAEASALAEQARQDQAQQAERALDERAEAETAEGLEREEANSDAAIAGRGETGDREETVSTASLLPEDSTSDFEVTIASLSDDAQAQVVEGVQDTELDGTLASADLTQMVQDAEAADRHKEQAETFQREQTKAADTGDFAGAREIAQKAELELQDVADRGGDTESEIIEAQRDVVALDEADWEQEIMEDNAVAADDYIETGEVDDADIYADEAVDHAERADHYGDQGDQENADASDDSSIHSS
jgi:hypothetical protein